MSVIRAWTFIKATTNRSTLKRKWNPLVVVVKPTTRSQTNLPATPGSTKPAQQRPWWDYTRTPTKYKQMQGTATISTATTLQIQRANWSSPIKGFLF